MAILLPNQVFNVGVLVEGKFLKLLHAEDNNNQTNFPYWKYGRFDLELLNEEECLTDFRFNKLDTIRFKGALSGLRQFLATESSLEMMKNVFYFTVKAPFIFKIFKFLS